MEKKNILKLYRVCLLLHDLCEEHTNCTFCPFSDDDGCMIEGETNIHADELYTLFCLTDLEERTEKHEQ